MRGLGAPQESSPTWTATWEALDRVLVADRSLVLVPTSGRACRFLTIRRHTIHRLLPRIAERGVPIERVRSTIRYAFFM